MAGHSSPPEGSFIRPYNPQTDLEAVVHVFRETCDASLRYEPAWTLGEYLWCRPYVMLCPQTSFVVDDGSGRAVGYIIGTPDTAAFNSAWFSQFVPAVSDALKTLANQHAPLDDRCRALLENVRDPARANYGDLAAQLAPYSAHLHIDILPSHQGRGLGKLLLMDAFLPALRAERATGVYLGMTARNDGAGRFYARNGFKRLPHVLDGGKSGEQGRTPTREDGGATIYWVRDRL